MCTKKRRVYGKRALFKWVPQRFEAGAVAPNCLPGSATDCVHSGLSQLSRIVPNNDNSHKSSMYQTVQTCILEVNSTRIGIKLPVDIV